MDLPNVHQMTWSSSTDEGFVDEGFQQRRKALLARLLEWESVPAYQVDPTNGVEPRSARCYLHAYEARMQHHHALLMAGDAEGVASEYYAVSQDLDDDLWNHPRNEPDWKMILLVRTWCQCQRWMTPAARDRIEVLMRRYRARISIGGTENHVVNRAVMIALISQELGLDDGKTIQACNVFRRWISSRGHRGYHEFNSPCYQNRSFQPLLLAHDFFEDHDLQNRARQALHQIMAGIALESISGSRGGPWHRATVPEEIVDARGDLSWMASHVFFGTAPLPPQIMHGAAWATTTYRVPEVIFNLATQLEQRGEYEIRRRVDSARPELNAYHYITPLYSLACFQGCPSFICNYYGSTNWSNLQPWELTFADPQKVLGVGRDLEDVSDFLNPNSALLQCGNILFFRGTWLDYNQNLGDPEIELHEDGRSLHFYRVPAVEDEVFVAITCFSHLQQGV